MTSLLLSFIHLDLVFMDVHAELEVLGGYVWKLVIGHKRSGHGWHRYFCKDLSSYLKVFTKV